MEEQCLVTLDTDANTATEAGEQTASTNTNSNTRRWKLAAALLTTLCFAVAGALLFAGKAKVEDHVQEADDIHHTLRQISGNLRAAIHLEGEYNDELKSSVEWKRNVNHYHAQGGLELIDNEIVIPQNGLYFVYSQVSFRVSCSSDDSDTSRPMVHLSHTIQRWSRSYGNDDNKKKYQTILHSVRTACQKTASSTPEEEGSWFTTIYMGAVFNLNRGDHLKTVMDEKLLPHLDEEPGKTFLGVFAL